MSSTRHAKSGDPISDERYMSSPELVQLRGISGTAVAARCKVLASPVKRELLFFLQALSLKEGSLVRVASELVKMFPKRIGTETMRKVGMSGSIRYGGYDLVEIDHEIAGESEEECRRRYAYESLGNSYESTQAAKESIPWQTKFAECREAALKAIPVFIVELCINPRMEFPAPGEDRLNAMKTETRLRAEQLGDHSSEDATIPQFEDIVGALFEYKRQYENSARASFCHTAISRRVWDALDGALKTRTMCLINGLPGRGKTEAVRAWCECHLGVARFVSLDGTSTKTAQFRELSKALGLGYGSSRKAQEMQYTVKEVLQRSGMMPVIDEAHFFFEQGTRIYSRPEMLDWIDTALCNPPIPVALITTPQFMTCMERAAVQAEWNYLQFQRRCKKTIPLPDKNTPEDVRAVAKHLLPSADANTLRLVLGYEKLSNRDLSAVGDVAREAKRIANEEGAEQVTFDHVDRAVSELTASDQPWAVLRHRIADGLEKKKAGRRIAMALGMQPNKESRTANQERISLPEPSQAGGRLAGSENARITAPMESDIVPV